MSKWTEFRNGAKFRLIEAKNRYTIEQLQDNGSALTFVFHTKPFTLQQNETSTYYKAFYDYAKGIWTGEELDGFKRYYKEFSQELIINRVTADELAKVEEAKKKASAENTQKSYNQYYEYQYTEFRRYMERFDKSPLELVVSTARCLVADSVREVVRAFVGYFQTITGIKATNVIAIGSPASGKSFVLERALAMMPQERIHYGVMTESAFFETFDGENLDGHIFALGDLGGVKDDEKSIAFRDLIKALSTDGKVSRTITKGDGKDRMPTKQVVKGHPALTYSTAHEEIVNEQEKSRSVILTPQPINPRALSIFNFVMENNGQYRDDIDTVFKVMESIRGLVYCFQYNQEDGFINPYEYCILEVLKDKEDYNRKIQEYEATLKVVTLLNYPWSTSHNYYLDEDNKPIESKLVFATKRDNLNAMNLFDAVNFLPDEARFGDKLLEYYEVFDLSDYVLESENFEEQIIEALTSEIHPWVTNVNGQGWKREAFYNTDTGFFSEQFPKFQKNVFTVSSLKQRFRGKWFNQHKHYLSERLRKLYDEDVLVKLGKNPNRENVYALNNNNGSKISEKLPSFDDESKILSFKQDTFDLVFPDYSEKWDEFILWDGDKPIEKSLTESVDALYKLPFIKEIKDV